MDEIQLINLITKKLPLDNSVIVGPGDDCAVLDLGFADEFLLFKTDAVVESIHFEPCTPPEKIGRKAIGRCLSDIAAMGGKPLYAVVTMGLTSSFELDFVQRLYEGLNALALKYHVSIVGGETTETPAKTFISVAMIGSVQKNRCVYRRGAKPGDLILVTGELGGSIYGKHLDFEPRIAEAIWLTQNFKINSMIDISDGLASDLRHILSASAVGAELDAEKIPISSAVSEKVKETFVTQNISSKLYAALCDGEDFELLFTIDKKYQDELIMKWHVAFPDLKLSIIGRIIPEYGLFIKINNKVVEFSDHGYIHFKTKK
jgi:thiamine-monophosphate kinase